MTDKLKKYAENIPTEERRDRTWFDELKVELQQHADRIEARLHRFFTMALVVLAVVGICSAVGLVGFGIVLKKQAQFSKDIQTQRFEVALDSCLDQNRRHDRVIESIDMAVAKTPKAQLKQAQKSAGPFKLILEAAVPYTEDCVSLARSRVTAKGRKK